jgi:hypothetical protein
MCVGARYLLILAETVKTLNNAVHAVASLNMTEYLTRREEN